MIEKWFGIGEDLVSIEIKEGSDVKSEQWMAYEIVIKTSKREIVIDGCHDGGPNLTIDGKYVDCEN